jgi:hypothetical protein
MNWLTSNPLPLLAACFLQANGGPLLAGKKNDDRRMGLLFGPLRHAYLRVATSRPVRIDADGARAARRLLPPSAPPRAFNPHSLVVGPRFSPINF